MQGSGCAWVKLEHFPFEILTPLIPYHQARSHGAMVLHSQRYIPICQELADRLSFWRAIGDLVFSLSSTELVLSMVGCAFLRPSRPFPCVTSWAVVREVRTRFGFVVRSFDRRRVR
jgi:hypothetical protein